MPIIIHSNTLQTITNISFDALKLFRVIMKLGVKIELHIATMSPLRAKLEGLGISRVDDVNWPPRSCA